MSSKHRIIKVGKELQDHQVHQHHHNHPWTLTPEPRSESSWALAEMVTPPPPWFWFLTNFSVKPLFLNLNVNLPWHGLRPFPLIFCATLEENKGSWDAFFSPFLQILGWRKPLWQLEGQPNPMSISKVAKAPPVLCQSPLGVHFHVLFLFLTGSRHHTKCPTAQESGTIPTYPCRKSSGPTKAGTGWFGQLGPATFMRNNSIYIPAAELIWHLFCQGLF